MPNYLPRLFDFFLNHILTRYREKKSKLMISLCTNFNARKRRKRPSFFWHKRFKTCNYPKAYMTLKRIIMLCTVAQTQEEGTWKRARQTSTITRITSQNPKIAWADFQFSLRSKVTQFCPKVLVIEHFSLGHNKSWSQSLLASREALNNNSS